MFRSEDLLDSIQWFCLQSLAIENNLGKGNYVLGHLGAFQTQTQN